MREAVFKSKLHVTSCSRMLTCDSFHAGACKNFHACKQFVPTLLCGLSSSAFMHGLTIELCKVFPGGGRGKVVHDRRWPFWAQGREPLLPTHPHPGLKRMLLPSGLNWGSGYSWRPEGGPLRALPVCLPQWQSPSKKLVRVTAAAAAMVLCMSGACASRVPVITTLQGSCMSGA